MIVTCMKVVCLYLFLLFMFPGKRELLIFYNQDGVALMNKQLFELEKDRKGLTDRDIIIHTLPLNTATAEMKKYRVDVIKPFTIILIGKDGGEKLRSDSILTQKKLFDIIDAMPMRQAEM